MNSSSALTKKAFEGIAQFLVTLAGLFMLSSWSLSYWEGWITWIVFAVEVTWITVYFLKRDPALIERRLKAGPLAESERSQKIIQLVTSVGFIALIAFPGFDHRFGWSPRIPTWIVLTGDLLVIAGFTATFFVFRENSYAAATIQIAQGQRVISTGPYRLVRHPMYASAIPIIIGIPIALGSLWGLVIGVPFLAALDVRLRDEERFLKKNLPGYAEYCSTTRYRLIPGIY